VTFKNTSQYST